MITHTVVLGYEPRPWQIEFHRGLKRFNIGICHRRSGKSYASGFEAIDCALSASRQHIAYVAPYLSQAKRIMWTMLKQLAHKIPYSEVREQEMMIVFANGSIIRCMGADNDDAIRGLGFDLVICDEFQLWAETVLPTVIIPTLAGRRGGIGGQLILIGTPTGIDPLTVQYDKALKNPELWAAWKFRADETGAISDEELALMRETMTPEQYRLEMLCDFDAGSPNQLIAGDMVEASFEREAIDKATLEVYPRILGIDIARQGDDETVIMRRQGPMTWEPTHYQEPDLMVNARKIAAEIDLFRPDAVFIDGGGVGAGAVDALRDMGYDIIEVQFGSGAADPRYANARAEMYALLKNWLARGGRLHPNPTIKLELTALTYKVDDKGRVLLESKADLKKRGMKSPDHGDALATTFYMPVQKKPKEGQYQEARHDWDPLVWRD